MQHPVAQVIRVSDEKPRLVVRDLFFDGLRVLASPSASPSDSAQGFDPHPHYRRPTACADLTGPGPNRRNPMLTAHDFDADQADREVAILLPGVRRLGVAFSGGVDSSVLLALAVRALGPGSVVAILGVSPSLADDERRSAHDVAAFIGAEVVEVVTHEGDRPAYQANGPDRCFHCKDELFATISDQLLQEHRLDAVAYGENADDAKRPDRPGARAATNHRVLRPLADAGWDKRTVRAIARDSAYRRRANPPRPAWPLGSPTTKP